MVWQYNTNNHFGVTLYIPQMSGARLRFAHWWCARFARFEKPTNNRVRSKAPGAPLVRKPDIHGAIHIPPWAASP